MAALTQFGANVTPNQHELVKEFQLLDNFYASGSLSADGHQWVVQGNAPDYLEKGFGGFVRSYPYAGGDSLAYLPTGFIWQNALRHSAQHPHAERAGGRQRSGGGQDYRCYQP